MASRARSSWFPLAEGLSPAGQPGNPALALTFAGGSVLDGWRFSGAPGRGLVLVALAQTNSH